MKYNDFRHVSTPSYVFSVPEFQDRLRFVKEALGGETALVYAVKANPFLVKAALPHADGFEACSPGEERILERAGIPGERFVISGVHKEEKEMRRIVRRYGAVPLYTAESPYQMALLDALGEECGVRLSVLLRISSGNQFGVDRAEAERILEKRESLSGSRIAGLHYFSGTQKRIKDTLREIAELDDYLEMLEKQYGYLAERLEFGPGLFVTYFEGEDEAREKEELAAVAAALREMRFSGKKAVELGRFLAAPCGYYVTRIADLKRTGDTEYAIMDGGIHQINYYGQTMAMKVPHLLTKETGSESDHVLPRPPIVTEPAESSRSEIGTAHTEEARPVTMCGALCTTADILIRKVMLPDPVPGDKVVFTRCGAYAVTEGISLFLSRDLPEVSLFDGAFFTCVRERQETEFFNYGEEA